MGPTLMMADEKQGYVLSDFATYLNFRDKISLVPLAAPHGCMKNPYAAIVVNPAKHGHVNSQLAEEWVDYLVSAETQDRIGRYQIAGEQLFRPTRLSTSK